MTEQVQYRKGELGDIEVIQLALYIAISWTGNPEIPPQDVALQHPELARYHSGWGRPGDIAVVAEVDGKPVGASFARLFTDDDHGHGYVDAATPEMGIGIVDDYRGKGIGRRLLDELHDLAPSEGIKKMSLSVNHTNQARHLYESLGYRTVESTDESSIMVLDLV